MADALPRRSLWIAAAVVLVAAVPGAPDLLIFRREAVLQGEVWRLLTAHLVHAGSYHMLWDVLPLLVLGALFEGVLGPRYWKLMAGSALIISAGVLLLQPDLPAYCGLSGVLNGLWVGGALAAAGHERASGRRSLALLYQGAVLLSLGKLGFEAWSGTALFTDPVELGAHPVPLAHGLGSLAGVLLLTKRGPALTHTSRTQPTQEVKEPCFPTFSTCSVSSTGCSEGRSRRAPRIRR